MIGFVGLGAMGLPMVARLAAAGNSVWVHDLDASRLRQVAALAGVHVAKDLKDLAQTCPVVISCLPSVEAVEQVYDASAGILSHLAPGSLIIECSTTGMAVAKRLCAAVEAHGSDFLEAPMFGAEERARSGELFLLLGGKQTAVDRALPIVRALATQWMHFGPAGCANAVKTAQNGLGLVQASAIAVALASVQKAGIDPMRFTEAVMRSGGMASSPLLSYLAPRMLTNDTPPFPAYAHIMRKDISLALQMAREAGTDCALLASTRAFIENIQERRFSDDGFQAMWRFALGEHP